MPRSICPHVYQMVGGCGFCIEPLGLSWVAGSGSWHCSMFAQFTQTRLRTRRVAMCEKGTAISSTACERVWCHTSMASTGPLASWFGRCVCVCVCACARDSGEGSHRAPLQCRRVPTCGLMVCQRTHTMRVRRADARRVMRRALCAWVYVAMGACPSQASVGSLWLGRPPCNTRLPRQPQHAQAALLQGTIWPTHARQTRAHGAASGAAVGGGGGSAWRHTALAPRRR